MGQQKKDRFVSSRSSGVAAKWGVSLRTAQSWLAAHPPVPVDDEAAMLAWVAAMPSASQRKLTAAFRRRIAEIRTARAAAGRDIPTDPDYAAFEASHAAAPSDKDSLSTLKRQRDFALFKIDRAQARGNLAELKDATEQLRHLSGVIHDEEFRAFRTGRELGDMVPLADVQRMFRALPFWLNRGAEDALTALASRISASSTSGPLFPEEVRRLAEPILLAKLVLGPALRTTVSRAGVALLPSAASAVRDGLALTLEEGAAEFDREAAALRSVVSAAAPPEPIPAAAAP